MRDRLFADKEFIKKLFRLTLPIAFQSLMLASVAAGDALMLGRVEQDQMAAVSLATQIQFVQNMILSSCTSAAAILGAQYWGKGDKKTIEDLFNMILRLCGITSVIFFAACELFPQYLMLAFAHDESLVAIGASYLRIAGWSYLLTGISQCYLTVMKVTDHVAPSAWISSGAVVINIALNSVFIFGLLGAPAMGSDGAALATLLARAVELILVIVLSFGKDYLRPSLRGLLHRNRVIAGDFRKIMLPLLGACLLWGVGFTSYTAIMGHLGGDAAAANSIAAVVRDMMCCLCNGIASAGGILVGNELGAGNLERGRLYGNRVTKLAYIIGFMATALVLLITPIIVPLMILTDTAREYLIGMMVIMAIYMIGRCVNTVVINGVFSAGGDTLFDVYSLTVTMWGIAIPTALLGAFVFRWPVLAVYACTCLDEVGKIPWVMLHYRKYKWVRDLTR
ncbi:MAG: MATE family efflux transporter [Clostridiales bacterium]|nr:MATE family efflux transporter [Clostridiales bacterium]